MIWEVVCVVIGWIERWLLPTSLCKQTVHIQSQLVGPYRCMTYQAGVGRMKGTFHGWVGQIICPIIIPILNLSFIVTQLLWSVHSFFQPSEDHKCVLLFSLFYNWGHGEIESGIWITGASECKRGYTGGLNWVPGPAVYMHSVFFIEFLTVVSKI